MAPSPRTAKTAEAPDEGGRVVVAGDRLERGHGLEEAWNLRAREIAEMEDPLDALRAKSPQETRGQLITEAGKVRIRHHPDFHSPVAGALRRSACSSACLTRRDNVISSVCVSPGTSLRSAEKCRRLMTSKRTGVSATTVADRGPPSSKLISPKNSPGWRGTCFSAETSTRAVPR